MDHSPRILILHATAGHGHEKAALAVAEALKAAPAPPAVRVEDSLAFTTGFFGRNYKGSYLYFIKKAAWFWGWLYYSSDARWLFFFLRPVRRVVNAVFAAGLVGSAEIAARFWLTGGRQVDKPEAEALISALSWRGIASFPLHGDHA